MPVSAVLEGLLIEATRVLDRQMATGEDLDSKASQLLRFDALIVGAVASAMALTLRAPAGAVPIPAWPVAFAGAGIASIGLSTLMALLAYEVTEYGIGLRARGLRQVLEDDPSEPEFLAELVHTYANLIEGNRQPLDKTARRLKWALWSLLAGLVLLGVAAGGFMHAAIP